MGEKIVVFTLKTVLTSIQYSSLSYSSRQRNEFPWSQANQNKVQKITIKIKKTQRKSQHLREKMIQVPKNNRFTLWPAPAGVGRDPPVGV